MLIWMAALLIILVVAVGALQAQGRRPQAPSEQQRMSNALRILEMRHLRGRISEVELEEQRRMLNGE